MRIHRWIGCVVLPAVALFGSLRLSATGGDEKADRVMTAAREALGGEAALNALSALSLRAEFRREMAGPAAGGGAMVIMRGPAGAMSSGGQVAGSLAIDVVFPDKYYREETTTGGLAMTRIEGFEGARPFLDIASSNPGTRIMVNNRADDPAAAATALKRGTADLARLLLGLIGRTHGAMPVTYTYAGEAESADAVADVIEVTGPDEFKARLFVDASSHLPLMLTYMQPEARVVQMVRRDGDEREPRAGAGSPPQLSPDERAQLEEQMKAANATPPTLVEHRMFFSEYREIDGIRLPHRIARGTAGKTVEEWEVKEYKLNPAIRADRFKVGAE